MAGRGNFFDEMNTQTKVLWIAAAVTGFVFLCIVFAPTDRARTPRMDYPQRQDTPFDRPR